MIGRTLLLLAWLVTLAGCTPRSEDTTNNERDAASSDPGYLAHDAEFVETDTEGRTRYRLRAAQARQNPTTRELQLRSVIMDMQAASGERWNLRAERGHMPPRSRRLELAGDVRLESRLADGVLQIRTASIVYDIDAGRARAPGAVTLRTRGGELAAHAVAIDIKARRVSLESKVHGHFAP